jgi:hypothetical protein
MNKCKLCSSKQTRKCPISRSDQRTNIINLVWISISNPDLPPLPHFNKKETPIPADKLQAARWAVTNPHSIVNILYDSRLLSTAHRQWIMNNAVEGVNFKDLSEYDDVLPPLTEVQQILTATGNLGFYIDLLKIAAIYIFFCDCWCSGEFGPFLYVQTDFDFPPIDLDRELPEVDAYGFRSYFSTPYTAENSFFLFDGSDPEMVTSIITSCWHEIQQILERQDYLTIGTDGLYNLHYQTVILEWTKKYIKEKKPNAVSLRTIPELKSYGPSEHLSRTWS